MAAPAWARKRCRLLRLCSNLSQADNSEHVGRCRRSCHSNYASVDLPKTLQMFGFSDYEGRAYVALVGREPLNGYELAKAANVPRPNVYAVLDKLLGKGAVTRLDRPDGTAYAAVAPRELF